jgi:hypothetical protein
LGKWEYGAMGNEVAFFNHSIYKPGFFEKPGLSIRFVNNNKNLLVGDSYAG